MIETLERLYKVLDHDGCPLYGGTGTWRLPEGDRPGAWMPPIEGTLEPCVLGYHLCRATDLVRWLGPVIYLAEARGERIDMSDKIVVREARLIRRLTTWTDQTARLFAADCAAHVLPLYEQIYPEDRRPRHVIAVARRFARGAATRIELDAAWNAARAAAWDAARDATRDAARAAAWGAAWGATRAATWGAAWGARAAAWGAARAAARAAAWADGRDAEHTWQTQRLFALLTVEE